MNWIHRHGWLGVALLAGCGSSGSSGSAPGGGDTGAGDDASIADTSSIGEDAADASADGALGDTDITTIDAAPDQANQRFDGGLVVGVWTNLTPPSLVTDGGHASQPCTDVQFDPNARATLYAMYGAGGLWKSVDGGAHWAALANDLPTPNSLGRILVDPRADHPGHMFATGSVQGSSLGFWVSTDGGAHWTIPAAFDAGAKTTWNYDVYNLVADPADFDHLLMSFHQPWPGMNEAAGLLETHDGGKTFVTHAPHPNMDHAQGIAILSDPAKGIGDGKTWLVGAGYGVGLFRTTDAGATWTQLSTTMQQNHGGFDLHYSKQGYLHLGMFYGVFRSVDNGATWAQLTTGAPGEPLYSVIGDGTHLYTGQSFVGVDYTAPLYMSDEGGADEGTTWTSMGNSIIPEGPWKMVYDDVNGIVYSATWGSGLWALKVR